MSEHGAPGLLGAARRSREAALRRLWRVARAGAAVGGTLDLYSLQIISTAFEGNLVSGRAGQLAGPWGLATLDGRLTAQGNVGCDQLLRNDVNCTDVFTQ